MKLKFYILALFLLAIISGLQAQQETLIKPSWDGIFFGEFTDSLLSNYGLRFYFEESSLAMIPIEFKGKSSLEDILRSFLEDQNLKFQYLDKKHIVIGPPAILDHRLHYSLFNSGNSKEPADYSVSLDYSLDDKDEINDPEVQVVSRVEDIGSPGGTVRGKEAVVSGKITEATTGAPIIGATVYAVNLQSGTVSNSSGMYFLKLPLGIHQVGVRFVGKKEVQITVNVYSDGILNVELEDKAMELKAVVVTSNKYHNIESTSMGVSRIDTRMMGSIPVVGEIDVLKVSMLLPGVQSVGEGTTGFNVRGGNTDQNLIILDNAPIFNPSHLMGFFSAFNAEIIRDFELHKSVIPARMGGRMASVMELNVKNGNKKKFSGSAGISPLTGKFNMEGPIIRDKLSFLVGGRSTYSNWLLKRIDNEEVRSSQASFYDMNAKLDYEINNKHTISLSGYYSNDDFYKNDKDTLFKYTNQSASLRWRFKINPGLIKNTYFIYSNYNNSITDVAKPESAYKVSYNIDYYEYKSDFTYFLSNQHLLNFGFSANYYSLLPGKFESAGEESLVIPERIENEQGSELSLYFSDEYKISRKLTLNAGLRYTLYGFFGPVSVFSYAEGLPRDLSTLRDTISYNSLEPAAVYHGPEPRISLRYLLGEDLSLKLGYSRMRQNVHIMSNTFSVSPTDTWKLSDPNLLPQISDQIGIGIYKNFAGGRIETSIEGYYKKLRGLKDYKVAATLLMNEHIETEIIDCEGKAYGIEFLLRKPSGKLNGWFSYTWSRILQKSDGIYPEEKINENNWFPAIYDKPHSISLVANYRFSRRISMSSNLVYSTGRPITYPVARYNYRNGSFLHYSDRNEYRVDNYFRWDLSFNLDGNLRTDQVAHNYWSISVYNVTGRDNIYSIYFESGRESVQGYKMSIFSEPIVSLSYNFRF